MICPAISLKPEYTLLTNSMEVVSKMQTFFCGAMDQNGHEVFTRELDAHGVLYDSLTACW